MKATPAGLSLLAADSYSAMNIAVLSFRELAEAITAGDLAKAQAAAERMQRQTLEASDCAASIARIANSMRVQGRRVG